VFILLLFILLVSVTLLFNINSKFPYYFYHNLYAGFPETCKLFQRFLQSKKVEKGCRRILTKSRSTKYVCLSTTCNFLQSSLTSSFFFSCHGLHYPLNWSGSEFIHRLDMTGSLERNISRSQGYTRQENAKYPYINQSCDPSDGVRVLELKAIVAYPVIPKLFHDDSSSCYHIMKHSFSKISTCISYSLLRTI
jgi:hypothetical protein